MTVSASILAGAIAIGSMACMQAAASSPQVPAKSALTRDEKLTYRVAADGESIDILREAAAADQMRRTTCRLSGRPTRARLSFDGSALLVTANGFVSVRALRSCGDTPLAIKTVAESAGILEDVNVSHGIYLGLLPVSTQPLAYLAVVAKLGSARNRIGLPGAYVSRQSNVQQLQQAFSYADEAGPFAKISPSGRYVAPNGEVDCSRDTYPGVWDLFAHQRLVLEGTLEEVKSSCIVLFEAATPR